MSDSGEGTAERTSRLGYQANRTYTLTLGAGLSSRLYVLRLIGDRLERPKAEWPSYCDFLAVTLEDLLRNPADRTRLRARRLEAYATLCVSFGRLQGFLVARICVADDSHSGVGG